MTSVPEMHNYGKHFGYPECCVEAFLEGSGARYLPETLWFLGTGFIACIKCATREEKELKAEIIRNRQCSIPFPEANISKPCYLEECGGK